MNFYLVIANDEVVGIFNDHTNAQEYARISSKGRFETAKVVYLPSRVVQGIWVKGERHA